MCRAYEGGHMKTIVVGNLKGGTGKTTSVANLAYSLQVLGKRVLVIDADPQTNLTPFFTKTVRNGHTLSEVLEDSKKVKRCICHSRYPEIDIIKGNSALQESDVTDGDRLENALWIVQEKYDYCIIDTRPAFERIAVSAMLAADILLTPVCLDKFCRDNLNLVDEFLSGMPEQYRPEWKIFANKVDSQRKSQRNIYKDLMEKHDYPFLETCISRSATIDNALEYYKPVKRHRAKSPVAQDYMDLAEEILALTGKEDA